MSTATIGQGFTSLETNAVSEKWFDSRITAAIRWLLASTALIFIYLDPSQPDNDNWALSYVFLALYMAYSMIFYFFSYRRARYLQICEPWLHWLDVAWFTLLTGMCSGTLRIFFFGYIFAILVASFRRGFGAGFSVVIVSTLSYTIISFSADAIGVDYGFEVFRFLLQPVYLVVLGYLIAYWGGQELMLKRRLALLKDITLSNPRFGVDRTINTILERLRDFFDADEALFVTTDIRASGHLLYQAERLSQHHNQSPETIAVNLAGKLLAIPPNYAVCFNKRPKSRPILAKEYNAYDVLKGERIYEGREKTDAVSSTIDAASFISVPVIRHAEVTGRMYFANRQPRSFNMSDVEFLLQVNKHVSPVIENIRLVDHLASDAAEQERRRIARDIHDSVIQPYIGFQIGLSGIQRKLASGKGDINVEIERLLEMTSIGITDLRQYISGLKSSDKRGTNLLSSIKRFISKFSEATGIVVKIEATNELDVHDSLAAEVFQMIAEGLSNIRRHTEATRATIGINCDERRLRLRMENDAPSGVEYIPFAPRSLMERAASLGGHAQVMKRQDGGTVIQIEIPL